MRRSSTPHRSLLALAALVALLAGLPAATAAGLAQATGAVMGRGAMDGGAMDSGAMNGGAMNGAACAAACPLMAARRAARGEMDRCAQPMECCVDGDEAPLPTVPLATTPTSGSDLVAPASATASALLAPTPPIGCPTPAAGPPPAPAGPPLHILHASLLR